MSIEMVFYHAPLQKRDKMTGLVPANVRREHDGVDMPLAAPPWQETRW
jgi:hypothetical protein